MLQTSVRRDTASRRTGKSSCAECGIENRIPFIQAYDSLVAKKPSIRGLWLEKQCMPPRSERRPKEITYSGIQCITQLYSFSNLITPFDGFAKGLLDQVEDLNTSKA